MANSRKQNKAALVTGGTRGIGRAISLGLAQNHARVIIANYLQDDQAAQNLKKDIERIGSKCVLAQANLAYPNEVDSLFEIVKSSVERLDILVHCAALGAFKPLKDIKPNQWDISMNVNTRSFLLCVQRSLPLMQEGKIIALSSLGSKKAIPNYGAIGPSKAALESVIRYLALELAPLNIQVNGVAGGFIETDSVTKFPEYEKMLDHVKKNTPAGRLGKPDDIAEVVSFLVSPSARWIFGQIIIADGGLSLV